MPTYMTTGSRLRGRVDASFQVRVGMIKQNFSSRGLKRADISRKENTHKLTLCFFLLFHFLSLELLFLLWVGLRRGEANL